MIKTWRQILAGILAGLLVGEMALPAMAQDNRADKAPEVPPTRAELTKLQTDVREQRQLIIQMMQTEQQRYDMLLRLLQGQGGGTPLPGVAAAPASAPSEPAPEVASEKQAKKSTTSAAAAATDRRPGSIEGRVTVNGGSIE